MMTDLANQIRDNVRIPERQVIQAASESSEEMTLLLHLRRDKVPITEEVVKAAAGSYYGQGGDGIAP